MGVTRDSWSAADPELVRLIHDLNNALQTVLVNTEFVAASVQVPQVKVDAMEANEAARRAARVARELARHLSQPRPSS
jgi:hypothetical protein